MTSAGDITLLLQDLDRGGEGALDALMDAVYSDLERIALAHLSREFGKNVRSVTIEPAGLVNELFLRMIKQRKAYDNRGQFFSIATKMMLRVLLDYKRKRLAVKRGGDQKRISFFLDGHAIPEESRSTNVEIEIESLSTALLELESIDSRQADVVKMRVVWGLNIEEIALALDMSASTVKRDWRFAKAWLTDEAMRLAGESLIN